MTTFHHQRNSNLPKGSIANPYGSETLARKHAREEREECYFVTYAGGATLHRANRPDRDGHQTCDVLGRWEEAA